MLGTIKLSVYDPITKELTMLETEADIKDGLAIHPDCATPELWTLTHVKSGFSCRHYENKSNAVRDRELFAQLSLNGVRFVDMEACEILSQATLFYEQLRELETSPRP